jgi:hypothetical protein
MLIPLGILAASGAGGVASDYELIATAFGTGSSGTITFSSIPQTYKHLQVRFTAKSTSTDRLINVRMNGVTSAVYGWHWLRGSSSSAGTGGSINQSSIGMFDAMNASVTELRVSAGIIDILDYSSASKNTTIRGLHGQVGDANSIYLQSGGYFQTTAVTSLSFIANANSFSTLTRFSLYGIKG